MPSAHTTLEAFLDAHYPAGPYRVEETFATNGQRQAYRLHSSAGQWVVKVTDPGRLETTVRADVGTPAYLADQGFPAPRPLPDRDGQLYLPYGDRFLYLYEYIPGSAPAPNSDFFRFLGRVLARLHSLPWNERIPISAYQPGEVLAEVRPRIQAISDPAQQPIAAELLEIIDHFPSFDGLPRGIIHTDPYFVNLLETPQHAIYLIDWEDSGVSYPLLDVAYVLAHLCTFTARDRAKWGVPGPTGGLVWRGDWARAFFNAYESVRPLTQAEHSLLPDAVRLCFVVYSVEWGTNELILDNYWRMKMVEGRYDFTGQG